MASIQGNNNNSSGNKNSIHLHRNHSSITRSGNARLQPAPFTAAGNGCPILSSPDSNDTAPILPAGRRDVGVGCNRLLGLAPLATACSSSAASSFYSSMLGADCSVSLRSRTDRNPSGTPGPRAAAVGPPRNGRLGGKESRFHHSKSHSISSSPRETTPVRHSAIIGMRGGSEKFSDRQKTASLPLPKRRQLSLSATEPTGTGLGVGDVSVQDPSLRVNIPGEEAFIHSNSLTGDNCSFDTATSGLGGQQQMRDSSCTLNSNSYKEQYILGCGHYRSNLKHYDALLAGGCVASGKESTVCVTPGKPATEEDLAMVELGAKNRSDEESEALRHPIGETSGTSLKIIPSVEPKTHHYPTNAKSLEDIL